MHTRSIKRILQNTIPVTQREKNHALKNVLTATSLVVQWLRRHASTAGGAGLIPGRGAKTPHAVQHGQKKKKSFNSNQKRKKQTNYKTICQLQ